MAIRDPSELNRDNNDDEEVRVQHYSSKHHILLLGEGDFSFSCSLATCFGSASNIYASSLDSYEKVKCREVKKRESECPQEEFLECTNRFNKVQASREPLPKPSLRFSGISHRICKGKVRKSLIRSSFTHPYTTGESRERSKSRQSNVRIWSSRSF